MKTSFVHNLFYFVPRLTGYGMSFGLIFGTLTVPMSGTMVGLVWGTIIGLLLGIGMGIGITVFNQRNPDDMDAEQQKNFAFNVGLITTLVMAFPLFILYAPIAGLTAAYVAHEYVDNQQGTGKRKVDDRYDKRLGVVSQASIKIFDSMRWSVVLMTILVPIGIIIIGLLQMPYNAPTYNTFGAIMTPAVIAFFGVPIYGFIATMIFAATNACLIKFLNRLFFTPDTPKAVYKRNLVAIIGVFTLFISSILTLVIGAPFVAAGAMFGTAKYVDWYYELDEKQKHHLEHDLALDDEFDADDDWLIDDADEFKVMQG